MSMFDNLLTFAEALTAPEGDLSPYQRTLVKSYAGLPLDRAETAVWRNATGRSSGISGWFRRYRPCPATECHLYCGRRAGKTTLGSIFMLWEAVSRKAPESQPWTIPIIAPGLRQGQRIALDLVRRKVVSSPDLAAFLVGETLDSLTFSSGITIRTLPPDPRLTQGFTSPAIWLDECSNFVDEGIGTLEAVLDAVRPSVATIPDARILLTSLPGPQAGFLWDSWNRRFEQDALIFKAGSEQMNPSLAQSEELAKAKKRPEHFQLFYSGEFTNAIQSLLPGDLVDKCFDLGRPEIPPAEFRGAFSAVGCDFATSSDDSASAICFRTKEDRLVVPWVRNWSVSGGRLHPISDYLAEIAGACRAYNVRKGAGDQHSLPVAMQYFSERGISYQRLVTNGVASEPIFDFLREQVRSGRLHLPENELLRRELKQLEERRVSGFEVAARRGKDDLAVAVATAVYLAGQLPIAVKMNCGGVFG